MFQANMFLYLTIFYIWFLCFYAGFSGSWWMISLPVLLLFIVVKPILKKYTNPASQPPRAIDTATQADSEG